LLACLLLLLLLLLLLYQESNLLKLAVEAARVRATLGEISLALEEKWGRHVAVSQVNMYLSMYVCNVRGWMDVGGGMGCVGCTGSISLLRSFGFISFVRGFD
jgi:hypothetical protein